MDSALTCPACQRTFPTIKGRNSHLSSSKKCPWYKKGKLKDLTPDYKYDINISEVAVPDFRLSLGNAPSTAAMDISPELPLEQIIEEADDPWEDFFHFLSPDLLHSVTGSTTEGCTSEVSVQASRSNHPDPTVGSLNDHDDTQVTESDPCHGRCLRRDEKMYEPWNGRCDTLDDDSDIEMVNGDITRNAYSPFASELDWRIANWVVRDEPGHNTFNRMLAIPGVVEKLGLSYHNIRSLHQIVDSLPERAGTWHIKDISFKDSPSEVYTIRHRDPREVIRGLWEDKSLSPHMQYAPKRVWSDSTRKKRIYNEMWTGKWWHAVQVRLPEGATIAPIIIATDKTQLTQFVGGKKAYPIYLTLGNIPKAIRHKPSTHACSLLGYLSIDTISRDGHTSAALRAKNHRLFHQSMCIILEPLIEAGHNGMELTGGNGEVRRVYPILAAYVADYPEQCLVTCSKYGTCPKCQCPSDQLGSSSIYQGRNPTWTMKVMADARQSTTSPSQYSSTCMGHGVNGYVPYPFWKDFPLCNINTSMTPDVLHQLYQGVFKHLSNWCAAPVTDNELDRQIKSLPPSYGLRHFKDGISKLNPVSGGERKNIAKILLVCVADKLPKKGLLACRSLLDFIYLAQYTSHDDETLTYLKESLATFHENKTYFIDAGVRENLNIPKFHSLVHYADSIEHFGTTDNYNSELFERLHIDFAKSGFRASNKRDEFPQMMTWLSRHEKMFSFASSLDLNKGDTSSMTAEEEEEGRDTLDSCDNPVLQDSSFFTSPLTSQGTTISITKHPSQHSKTISQIEITHNAPTFGHHLKSFLNALAPHSSTRRELLYRTLPVKHLDVYHQFTLQLNDMDDSEDPTKDIIKAQPRTKSGRGRFDPVVVLTKDDAESTGLQGTRIGRLRVIFRLPKAIDSLAVPRFWPKEPLAFVEWYQPLKSQADYRYLLMYSVRSVSAPHGAHHDTHSTHPPGAIVSLRHVRQSCHLVPLLGKNDQVSWTTDSALDNGKVFLVNNFASKYMYKTVW